MIELEKLAYAASLPPFVAAGAVALAIALNMWGLVELDKLASAAFLTPFIPVGVKEYSREEAFKILREASDPYRSSGKLPRRQSPRMRSWLSLGSR